MYGLAQSARQYYKNGFKILYKNGFYDCEIDPCLCWKHYEKGILCVAVDVDDNLIVCHLEAIEDTIEHLKQSDLLSMWRKISESICPVKFDSI